MKKLLLLAAVNLFYFGTTNAQTRLVLYEEFTGETCPSCASANPTLDAMMATAPNTTKIHMIKYMCNIPSSGPFYLMTSAMFETTRQTYYSVPFAPFGTIDGSIPDGSTPYPGYPAYLTQTDLDNGAAIPSPFTITVNSHYNTAKDSVTINVTVTAIAAYAPAGGNIKLRTALCRSLLFDAPVSNGETDFVNVVRNMYPSAAGTSISNSWTVGMTQTYTLKGAVPSEYLAGMPHHATDSSVVAWIQNDADKKIAQSGVAKIIPLGTTIETAPVSSFIVFPNPAKDQAVLSFETVNGGTAKVTVTDVSGRTVLELPAEKVNAGTNRISLNTAAFASGLYSVRLDMDGASMARSLSVVK